ncbi:PR-1-like protein, partial [Backusella circina FSU 941]
IVVVVVALLHSAEALTADERTRFLDLHNNYRLKHHAPKLTYDNNLEVYSQRVVNTCKMVHSTSPYGENLAWGYKTLEAATNAWYNEAGNYDYENPGYGIHTGHFTQIVWKDTDAIGCASHLCTDVYMYACSYKDAGNIVGSNNTYFKQNVLP